MFICYLKACLTDKIQEIRVGIIYNLPCFYFTFKSSDEGVQSMFE